MTSTKKRTKKSTVALPAPTPTIDGVTWASSTVEGETRWLWPGAIPAGSIVLLEGRKATGKSTVAASIAAAITTSTAPPGWSAPPGGRVLWHASEDSWECVVVPRLRAAKADLAAIGRLDGVKFVGTRKRLSLPDDIQFLEDTIRAAEVRMMVLDPYISLARSDLDVRVEQQARMYLDPLAAAAARTGCVCLLLRHLRKGRGGDAREAGLGSVAVANAARSVLRCDEHPDDRKRFVLSVVASNYGPRMSTQVYSITETPSGQPCVEWHGCSDLDADTIGEGRGDLAARDEYSDAERLLFESIGLGWVRATVIVSEAGRAGVGERTLRSAKARLGVPSRRIDSGGDAWWEWGPPPAGWTDGLARDVHDDATLQGCKPAHAPPPLNARTVMEGGACADMHACRVDRANRVPNDSGEGVSHG